MDFGEEKAIPRLLTSPGKDAEGFGTRWVGREVLITIHSHWVKEMQVRGWKTAPSENKDHWVLHRLGASGWEQATFTPCSTVIFIWVFLIKILIIQGMSRGLAESAKFGKERGVRNKGTEQETPVRREKSHTDWAPRVFGGSLHSVLGLWLSSVFSIQDVSWVPKNYNYMKSLLDHVKHIQSDTQTHTPKKDMKLYVFFLFTN